MTETIVVIKMRNMNASGSGHGEAGPIMSNVKEESLKERGGGGEGAGDSLDVAREESKKVMMMQPSG